MRSEAVNESREWLSIQGKTIWAEAITKGLWRRILKVVLATTVANALMLVPQVEASLGKAVYLAGIVTGFGHPGRRFGQMAEALTLTVLGTMLGLGWSIFGVYLASLLIKNNPPAAYAIRGVFLAIAFLLHGFYRSHTPRLFLGTVLWIIVNVVTLLAPTTSVTTTSVTQILYPILIAVGLLFLVNICIFPEFSSRFLGETAVDTIDKHLKACKEAIEYFLGNIPGEIIKENAFTIEDVTTSKAALRTSLAACKAVQSECSFELAFSILPPAGLKQISDVLLTKLTMNIIAMINACESRFALLGDDNAEEGEKNASEQESITSSKGLSAVGGDPGALPKRLSVLNETDDLELVKPRREIEFGDPDLLLDLTGRIAVPCQQLVQVLDTSLQSVKRNIAYVYRVPKDMPKTVELEVVDLEIESLRSAMDRFDADIQASLSSTHGWKEAKDMTSDIMPREEIFLISSFYLNMRQSARQICEMLQCSRDLVDRCQKRNLRRRFYTPQIKWKKWLYSGGEDDQPTAEMGHLQSAIYAGMKSREPNDGEEAPLVAASTLTGETPSRHDKKTGVTQPSSLRPLGNRDADSHQQPEGYHSEQKNYERIGRLRERLADTLEWAQNSNDVGYAFKLCIASFLTVWPALVARWNTWYSLNRGLWAALQLVLITEPTLGTSINTFILRAVGTTGGCLWGWAAYGAGGGNRWVCGVMIAIGTIPAAYVIVCTKYVKAGIVVVVSITVVALATELETVSGSSTENFLKRYIAFTIGAVVSLFVSVAFFPVKASTRMVDALARSLDSIGEMENCVSFGIEQPTAKHILTQYTIRRFNKATSKAKAAIQTAEGLVPFAKAEPRLKGSFDGSLAIYKEIIFVIHQIIDRMENMIVLRTEYGSGPLSRYNSQIYRYRRNLAASIILTLSSVQGALTTKLPLPQFLPSCRLAQLRLINRVRSAVQDDETWQKEADPTSAIRRQTARTDWISWSAGSMAQAEIVEYLEELVDLAKLIVGANEFRSGLLTRPTYREYVQKIEREEAVGGVPIRTPTNRTAERVASNPKQGELRRRATTLDSSKGDEGAELPYALRRIQSKRQEANLKRQETRLS